MSLARVTAVATPGLIGVLAWWLSRRPGGDQ